MKQKLMVQVPVVVFALLLALGSCRHEIPGGDPCLTNTITMTVNKTDATGGQNNGTISATTVGGTDFRYSLNGSAFQDTGYFASLQPFQTYNLVVKNSWGCTDTAQISINVNDPCAGVTVAVTATPTSALNGQSNGSITASATGGTGFTYSINGVNYQASGTFSNLAPGNYTITAKNANGCSGVALVTVGNTNPCAGVTIAVTTTQVNPGTGLSNGSITATATGGTGGYTYSLNSGAFQASNVFSGLATGNYTVTAKTAAGCTGSASVALGASNPCAGVTVTVTLAKVDPALNQSNGSITATASGATGFTYSLNGGAYQASNVFSALAAGTYTVTAKSSAGCLGTGQITLTGVNPCNNVTITLSAATVNYTPCLTPASGKITITAAGSTGFTYSLNGGVYQASNVFSTLVGGNYTISAKDLNGCIGNNTATIPTASAGPLFAAVKTIINTRCSGSGCHMNGGSAAGYNFDNDCSIVSEWSKIRSSSVTGNNMPKSPQAKLTTAEKAAITNWINAGHLYTN